MNIMADRIRYLQQIIDGFLQTQTPLILFDGVKTLPFYTFDDIGIYVIIPQLVRMFGINLEQAINCFFYGIIISSFALGLLGFLLYYKSVFSKSVACCGLAFLLYFITKFNITDVYLAYMASALSIIPLFLYFVTKNTTSNCWYFFTFIAGIFITTFHYIRAYSSLAPLLFIFILLISSSAISLRKKIVLFCCLIAGTLCPRYYFTTIINQNQHYAQMHFPDADQVIHKHVFWHPIYLGFGFLSCLNEDNIQFKDGFGLQKAQMRNPSVSFEHTKEYESIIKEEALLLCKKQPWFVVYTIFAKIGILLLFLLIFSNFGLLATAYFPKPWYLELAFFLSFCANALFPLIAVPYFCYSLGFITIATLYGIISINYALSMLDFKKIFQKFYSWKPKHSLIK